MMGPKTQALQLFLKEAKERFPDLLALSADAAWESLRADLPVPGGLRTQWRHEQAIQAAPRALKVVAPLPIALDTPADRELLASLLLLYRHQVSDASLLAWLAGMVRFAEKHLFQEQIERLFPEVNIEGYRAISAEAARVGWPRMFQEDMAIDLNTLCSVGAPKAFWWGVRSTGTDLFVPNDLFSLEWALARKTHGPGEQLHYHYTGTTLRPVKLDTLIAQLARTLHPKVYEQRWNDAMMAKVQAEQARFRGFEAMNAYYEACQAATRAEEAYWKVKRLKQQYS